MPRQAWSPKRERQYEDIKEGLLKRGDSEQLAEEIAARTVNKARARVERAGRRAGHPSMTSRPRAAVACAHIVVRVVGPRSSWYEEARRKGVSGRSNMTKSELERALAC